MNDFSKFDVIGYMIKHCIQDPSSYNVLKDFFVNTKINNVKVEFNQDGTAEIMTIKFINPDCVDSKLVSQAAMPFTIRSDVGVAEVWWIALVIGYLRDYYPDGMIDLFNKIKHHYQTAGENYLDEL